LFNYPLCWLIVLLGAPVNYLFHLTLDVPYLGVGMMVLNQSLLIGTSLYLCVWSNIYIKKLHEQSSLYFKEPS
jgi:hypothetical protein